MRRLLHGYGFEAFRLFRLRALGSRRLTRAEARRRRGKGFQASSSSGQPVIRFTDAHAPDFLSLSAALRLCARILLQECGVFDSCSGPLASDGDGYGVRGCRGSVAPAGAGCSWGGRNPALTRWAIICRPSGPGATALEGARLRWCVGIEQGFSLWVFDTDADPDPDPDTEAGGEVWPGGFFVRGGRGVH